MSRDAVIASFDRIATLSIESWNHNNHYHRLLLRCLPERRGSVLDIGCGLGDLCRLLASRFDRVEGIDFSPKMTELATDRSRPYPNIVYRCADFLEAEYPAGSFDCVVSVATFHHLPHREALRKAAAILKPGGRLLLLDLYRSRTPADYAVSALGLVVSRIARVVRGARTSRELAKAWTEHGRHDRYATLAEVRQACDGILPQARLRRHIYFRYSLLWENDDDATRQNGKP